MEKYLNYTLEQLLWDDSFRKLILHPTPEQELAKNKWLANHQDQAEVFLEAQDIIRAVKTDKNQLPERDRLEAMEQIFSNTSRKPVLQAPMLPLTTLMRVAASVILVAGLMIVGKRMLNVPSGFIQTAKSENISQTNHSRVAQLIRLEDGSAVVLKPGSNITFPKHFDKQKRLVQLTGEAFFEISRNPNRPFFVYAGKSVTKVLGTSFNVRAFEADDAITVKVKTGKVAVYFEDKIPENLEKPALNILEPNEQIILTKQDNSFRKSNTDDSFYSENTNPTGQQAERNVAELFKGMQKFYGVQIEFDTQKLRNCTVLANLTGLHLLEKLDAICLAINATYTIHRGKVTINGDGC
ncbi:FecR family protein [Dyadobacter diqingensis]|uniref:FecR family protein n=1 Tax=Dyadobacter diqingensis TaxID=2938121 RepID=UPI0020C1B692|nr:FecR family protein [Dyadobacter diqingensis]